jgi:hypothetical protein
MEILTDITQKCYIVLNYKKNAQYTIYTKSLFSEYV